MNKSNIEWCDFTYNPVTGCTRGCPYCYARRMAQRLRGRAGYPQDAPFRPTWHEDMWLRANPVRPARIFVCSMGELFSPDVPDEWVERILQRVRVSPKHTFIFLTKNPHLLAEWNPWPKNAWVGATVTDTDMLLTAQQEFEAIDAPVLFLSMEPMLSRLDQLWTLATFDWLIIGAQSGPGARKHWPRREWVDELHDAADRAGIPVFDKNNLRAPFPSLSLRREWPDA